MDAISFHVTIRKDNYPVLFEALCNIKQGRQRSEKMQFFANEFAETKYQMASGGEASSQTHTPTTQENSESQSTENPALAASLLSGNGL